MRDMKMAEISVGFAEAVSATLGRIGSGRSMLVSMVAGVGLAAAVMGNGVSAQTRNGGQTFLDALSGGHEPVAAKTANVSAPVIPMARKSALVDTKFTPNG